MHNITISSWLFDWWVNIGAKHIGNYQKHTHYCYKLLYLFLRDTLIFLVVFHTHHNQQYEGIIMTIKSPFSVDKSTLTHALSQSTQGTWQGEGTDVFPSPHGNVTTKYIETMTLGEPFETVNPDGPNSGQTHVPAR